MFQVNNSTKKIVYHLQLAYRCMALTLLLFISAYSHASLYKDLWTKWLVHNPLSTQIISHELWQEFLDEHVSTNSENINLVNYPLIKSKDLLLLKRYLAQMSQINLANYNRNEQLAYWINVYNALTVFTVAEYYPVSNIQEIRISPGLFSVGPWEANLITILGTQMSLDDINNRVIRPIWNDPRTLYTLNNATFGAPNLNKHAYHGKDIEKQLNNAATHYINSLRGAQVIEGQLVISKLYHWYEEDFGGTKQDVIFHLLEYAHEPLKSQLKHINTIDSYIYNWHINSPVSSNSHKK